MANIVSCARCGKMERYKGSGHVQCTFCKAPFSRSSSELAIIPDREPTKPANSVVSMTVYGALWGGGIAGSISVVFHGYSLFVLLALLSAPPRLDAAPGPDLASFVMWFFLLPMAIGAYEGVLLIGLAGAALHRYPTLSWMTTIGAAAGAIFAPAVVLAAIGLAMLYGAEFVTVHGSNPFGF